MTESTSQRAHPGTVGEALEHCHQVLANSDVYYGHGTDNAWDEAVQLVLALAGLPVDADDSVLPQTLPADTITRIKQVLLQRVEQHKPLPYLLGRAYFAGLQFLCDERAIIPRSPLAELILNDFKPWYGGPPPARILDLCCGGGCIGLAVAHYFPDTTVDLVDLDPAALALARDNAAALGLTQRVDIIQSDLFAALAGRRYDLILSNPPYVDSEDLAGLPAEYLHEPELALGSGTDGLDLTRRILATARQYLQDTGMLILEVGNSWPALETAYPRLPFTWLEFEHGGHGVFALSAEELQESGASPRG